MFFSYLKIALRSLRKNKFSSILNVLGLSVGISAALVIFIIVRYDYSFDKWEPDSSQIYRVYTKYGKYFFRGINLQAPNAIKQNVTGVKAVAHFIEGRSLHYAQVDGSAAYLRHWGNLGFADPGYFNLFPHKWLVGSPEVLKDLNSMVLAESEVGRFFPGATYQDVIGRVIQFDDSVRLTVKGIVADIKGKSDFDFKNFVSLNTFTQTNLFKNESEDNWNTVNDRSQCLIKIAPNVNVASVAAQIKALYEKRSEGVDSSDRSVGLLQPLSHVHFNTEVYGVVEKSALVKLSILAVLLLSIAIINYINLSTAQSTLRAKEIGIRKIFGSGKGAIIRQFLLETFVLTAVATFLAILLVPFILRVFNGAIPHGLHMSVLFQPQIVLALLCLILLVSLLAGFYPAFVLTRFEPVAVLKGQVVNAGKSRGGLFRKSLTVAQFVFAQVFFLLMVVVGRQLHYMMQKDLGFRQKGIINFKIPDADQMPQNGKEAFISELQKLPGIQDISLSTRTPIKASQFLWDFNLAWGGNTSSFQKVHVSQIDQNYLSLFDLKLLAGRNLRTSQKQTVGEALINLTFLKKMGFQDPTTVLGSYLVEGNGDSSRIVGVLKDFASQNLHKAMAPTALVADNQIKGNTVSVLFNNKDAESWAATITTIGKAFKKFYPKAVFDYEFYDQSIQQLYNFDLRVSFLLKWATGLAIFISCLGLLGLVSFMTGQRTKEIGIRKVLGASIINIMYLLSKNLIRLVLLACAIALPLAWYFSHKWLEDFAYKIRVGWITFILCALGMLLIALAVLWLRTFKAASANPVSSLRDE